MVRLKNKKTANKVQLALKTTNNRSTTLETNVEQNSHPQIEIAGQTNKQQKQSALMMSEQNYKYKEKLRVQHLDH